ncbi:alpha/beta fold hydrolase [Aquirhabdus sp.]|uniref:alpha/beta fold hydrolase n=1 Tax=Aquirhabdus sp. TaxID=2824160 RepID=UPI00396CF806
MPLTVLRSILNELNHTASVPLRDGHYLKVRVLGTTMGQSVLMLPGLGMSASHWLPFVARYAHQYRFYMPDLRGAGLSSHVPFNQADVFQNHMEDIQDLIAHYRLKDILLVGYSLGATTSMHLQRAGQFELVKRYLHIDQSPCIRNQDNWSYGLVGERQSELFQNMREAAELLSHYPLATYLGDIPAKFQGDIVDKIENIILMLSGQTAKKPWYKLALLGLLPFSNRLPLTKIEDIQTYFAAYTGEGYDYRESLKDCTTPITQIVGMQSQLYDPRGQMQIAKYAKHVKVIPFERSGHAPLITEPVKFTRVLGEFLADTKAETSQIRISS